MISAVFFDMDGVLIDSEELSIETGLAFFRSKGYEASADIFRPFLGAGEYVFFMGPAEREGFDISYEEASAFFKEHYPALVRRKDPSLPGGKALVRALCKKGIATAVVSSAPHWKVVDNIAAIGLCEADFTIVLSGESVKRNKPAGDIYLEAAIRCGVDPSLCLVVEDSLNGIRSGHAAGMRVLALTTSEELSDIIPLDAEYIADDLSSLVYDGEGDFEEVLRSLPDERLLYGANRILPAKREESDEDLIKEMIRLAKEARENAYAPYSRFKVGAALLSSASGKIYTGCNVENSSYGGTICAERGAIMKAVSEEGVIGIDILAVVADDNPPTPPCGLCRQVLSEFCKEDTLIVMADLEGNTSRLTFSQIMPNTFIMPAMRK